MSAIEPDHDILVGEDEDINRAARAALLAQLAGVVDLATLTEGDDEFDYFLRVPVRELHETTQRISEAMYDVNVEFGVWVRVFSIPVGQR